jgi:WD40 repeat protein
MKACRTLVSSLDFVCGPINSALLVAGVLVVAMPSRLDAQAKTLKVQTPRGKGSYDEVHRFTDHTGAVAALALSPNGRHLATAGADHAVHIIDGKTWKSTRKLSVDADVKDVEFMPTGELVVAGHKSQTYNAGTYVWNWNTNKVLAAWNDAAAGVVDVAVSPDGNVVAAVEGDGRTRLMSRRHNATLVLEEPHPSYRRTSLGFSPDSKTLTTGGINGFVHRWRLGLEGKAMYRGPNQSFHPDFRSYIRASIYAPDGSCVGTAHDDGTARIYLEKAKLRYRLMGHEGGALCVAFTPDSKYIASGGNDKTIRVWDVAAGTLLWEISGHTGAVTRVLAPSEETIVSASGDGTVRFWRRGGEVDPALADVLADEMRVRPERKASLAVPKTAELVKSRSLIKEVFAADFAKATDDNGRRGLATKLLDQARQQENAAVERYAALEAAQQLAIDGKAIQLAIEIADEFGVWFEGDSIARLVEVAQGLSATCRSTQERASLAKAALQLVDDATAADRYIDASRLVEVATSAALAARNPALQEAAKVVSERVEAARAAVVTYQNALKLLAKDPADPAANLVAGRFLCFLRGDWQNGVPHLARSSDANLRKAAEQELAKPDDVDDWEALGDLWQAAAEAASPSDRPACAASAEFWYAKALEASTGLRKVKLQRSLEKVGPVPQQVKRRDAN